MEDIRKKINNLSDKDLSFLIEYLKANGKYNIIAKNLSKNPTSKRKYSYRTVKAEYDSLMASLQLNDEQETNISDIHNQIMNSWDLESEPYKASTIVKRYLKDHNGHFYVESIRGKKYEISLLPSKPKRNDVDINESFYCPDLQVSKPYEFRIFDIIADELYENGPMLKTDKNNSKDPSVFNTIRQKYLGLKPSDEKKTYNPLFVVASIMAECGIVYNEKGRMSLTEEYKKGDKNGFFN